MSVMRRAPVVLSAVLVGAAAPAPAQAARVSTLPCVPHISGARTMPVAGAGFRPGTVARLYTTTPSRRSLRLLRSVRVNARGGFRILVRTPRMQSERRTIQRFRLIARDPARPRRLIAAPIGFRVVRFGLTRSPRPRRPGQRVTYTARGFQPGRRVYAHFRFGSITRRTVRIGVARGHCGIAERRMRVLPTKVRYGQWRVYVDQSERFSRRTRPQWIEPFRISRPKPKPKPKPTAAR